MRWLVATFAAVALAVVACAPATLDASPGRPSAPLEPGVVGVATDEPCTRTLPLGEEPPPIRFHAEDLERMVLTAKDLGGLRGFEPDPVGHGYQGNAELESVEVHPDGTCADLARFERVIGFSASNIATGAATQDRVSTSAHLFWDADGARAWAERFLAGMAAAASAPDAPIRFDVQPLPGGVGGDVLADHVGPDGTRTWAFVVRGSVVGWVIDLHQGTSTIDVPKAASALARRIEDVEAEVAARPVSGLDVAALMSAPLPLVEYGPGYADLAWDSFFGGCADIVERATIAGDEAADDAIEFGRVSGCTALYAPPDGALGPIERVFSSVSVCATEGGASGALTAGVGDMRELGGTPFPMPALGDEAAGILTPPGGDRTSTDTRALVRIGRHLLVVAVQDREPPARSNEVATLATKLAARVDALLAQAD